MDNQNFVFNRFYNHLADIFVRFCLTLAPLNNALRNNALKCPTEYVSRLHIERQLINYALTFNGRFLYHHLVGGFCIFQCRFCEITSQFRSRHPQRNCFQCRLRRWSHRCTCLSRRDRRVNRRSRILAESFNMAPLSIVSAHGVHVVARISNHNTCTLFDALNQFIPSDNYQAELLIEFLALLHMNGLSPPVLNRHFSRHITNL